METCMYLRKSRAEALEDNAGATLRRHREILLENAQQRGLVISEIYEEVVSGENLYARPEMLRLLADAEAGKFGAVLCMDIDRLGRGSMSQQGVILETLKAAGVRIITPQKVYDLNDEADEDYTELQTFFARKELKLIKKRMRRGMVKTAEEGGYLANAPYGYRKSRAGRLPSLAIDQEEARYVRLMFQLYAQGEGCTAIAGFLNSSGARPRRGGAFSRTTVMAILKNPVYMGKILWNRSKFLRQGGGACRKVENDRADWVVAEGVHPAIVPEALFCQVQQAMQHRSRPSCRQGGVVNPFAGLFRCAHCGQVMQLRNYPSRGAGYLLCTKKGCMPAARFPLLQAAVLRALAPRLEALHAAEGQAGRALLERQLVLLQREGQRLQQQRARLCDLLEQGVYTGETFRERSLSLDRRQEALAAQRERLRTGDGAPRAGASLAQVLAGLPPEGQNRLWKLLFSSARCRREKGWPPGRFVLEFQLRLRL